MAINPAANATNLPQLQQQAAAATAALAQLQGGGGAATGQPATTAATTATPGTGTAATTAAAAGAAATPPRSTQFQAADSQKLVVNLDTAPGLATGLSNLARIFGARQERVSGLSQALARDANVNGSFNPVDLQRMSLETTTTQQLSEMQKKIFDSMRDSISPWLQR